MVETANFVKSPLRDAWSAGWGESAMPRAQILRLGNASAHDVRPRAAPTLAGSSAPNAAVAPCEPQRHQQAEGERDSIDPPRNWPVAKRPDHEYTHARGTDEDGGQPGVEASWMRSRAHRGGKRACIIPATAQIMTVPSLPETDAPGAARATKTRLGLCHQATRSCDSFEAAHVQFDHEHSFHESSGDERDD
jgi:hypothetical protein